MYKEQLRTFFLRCKQDVYMKFYQRYNTLL